MAMRSRFNQGTAGPYGNGSRNGAAAAYDTSAATDYQRLDGRQANMYDLPSDRSRERRAGGYGNLAPIDAQYDSSPSSTQAHLHRPNELERRKARRRSRSRSRTGEGRAEKEIEDVVDYIKQEWPFMTEDECVPVQVALQLLDDSSLGLASRSDEFHETQERLQSALKAVVNEHHQAFNSSIGTFHQIQGSIHASQRRVRALKESLLGARINLSSTRPELKELYTSAQEYEAMLEVLNTIEELQQLPAKLEGTISEKRFLTAVDLLQDALRLARRSDLEDINALNDLKVFLSNQEHTLTDILIEELHNHLYLKSPYCEDRWKEFAKLQDTTSLGGAAPPAIGPREMVVFLDALDTSEPKQENTSRTPEVDTFEYIHLVLEALQKLGRLDVAVDSVEQRLPVELYRVIEKSITEVEQHHPSLKQAREPPRDIFDIDSEQRRHARFVVLHDLLRTAYARFEAIAESHRVMHDIVAGIAKRDPSWNAQRLTRGFKELWKLYQSEIRSLLHDYLSSDGSAAGRAGGNLADRNIFRYKRDKSKRLFKLEWTDASSPELSSETDDLMQIFKSFVPGLVTAPLDASGTSLGQGSSDGSAAGHRLLIEPSVFNMGILLPPSITFLRRLKDIVPAGSEIVISTLSSFLNDFLINVFHPQLEDTLNDFCMHSVIELDAFQQDVQWFLHAQRPIFQGTIKFYTIIMTFCKMLDSLTHDQLFSQLVVSQLNLYYDKCQSWYSDLVSRSQPRAEETRTLKAAAAFAAQGEIKDVVVEVLSNQDADKTKALSEKETQLLIKVTGTDELSDADLLADPKSMSALCLLHTSMMWLATKLDQLRLISGRAFDSSGNTEAEKPPLKRSLTGILSHSANDEGRPVYLPLNKETAAAFDAVVEKYQDLAATTLRTLHLEFRCHMIRNIRKSIEASHQLPQAIEEADNAVLALVGDLVAINEELRLHLPPKEHVFVVQGSGALLDALLVRSAASIKRMNAHGCARMMLNVVVLRQNLLNIDRETTLARAALYFGLFQKGPEAIVAAAKRNDDPAKKAELSEEELKTLLELYFSEAATSPNGDEALRAQRRLNDSLLQLSEAMWSP